MPTPTHTTLSVRRIGLGVAVLTGPLATLEVLSQPAREAAIGPPSDVVGVALALLATLPYVAIDRRPRTVVVLNGAALAAGALAGHFTNLGSLAGFIGVGLCAFRAGKAGVAVALPAAATGVILVPTLTFALPLSAVLINGLAMIFVALFGLGARTQLRYASELEARTRELEALREVETRAAVAQERVRIAREVHDAVGHALAAIALHARVANRRLERDPPAAAGALTEIAELATSALADTRDAVGQLRTRDGAELRPAPGLDDLDALVDGLSASDLDIVLRREGDGAAVPQAVQAAAFRIVQESLSNVAKHARGAAAAVVLRRERETLLIEISDDGREAPGAVGEGHGLVGMRERAMSLGGTFEAGPAAGGGWHVRATLPIRTAGS